MFGTLVQCNNSLTWDMTHVLDANSSTPFLPNSGTFTVDTVHNLWYPEQYLLGSYFSDVDTGLNVLEGALITLSAPIATWCAATYYNNATQICGDARGVTAFSFYGAMKANLIGCDEFYWIFPNSTGYNYSSYDNSGCNSGAMTEPPNLALLFRVGSNNQGHSPIDYATAFTDRTQTGTLTATYRAPATGRLYLAAAVMLDKNVLSFNSATGTATQSPTYGLPYTGTQTVTITTTPPAEISFGFTWSPAASAVSQPYYVAPPASLQPTDLAAAGYTLVSSAAAVSGGLGAGQATGQYIYLQLPEQVNSAFVYTSTFYAYIDLLEVDSAPAQAASSSAAAAASTAAGATSAPAGATSTQKPPTSAAPTAAASTGGNPTQPTSGASSNAVSAVAQLAALTTAVFVLVLTL